VVGSSTYYRVWQEAHALALPPAGVPLRSRLARMTSGTRRCRPGSMPGWTRRRSPNVRATVWRSC
jgi:hypothetical protein